MRWHSYRLVSITFKGIFGKSAPVLFELVNVVHDPVHISFAASEETVTNILKFASVSTTVRIIRPSTDACQKSQKLDARDLPAKYWLLSTVSRLVRNSSFSS